VLIILIYFEITCSEIFYGHLDSFVTFFLIGVISNPEKNSVMSIQHHYVFRYEVSLCEVCNLLRCGRELQ